MVAANRGGIVFPKLKYTRLGSGWDSKGTRCFYCSAITGLQRAMHHSDQNWETDRDSIENHRLLWTAIASHPKGQNESIMYINKPITTVGITKVLINSNAHLPGNWQANKKAMMIAGTITNEMADNETLKDIATIFHSSWSNSPVDSLHQALFVIGSWSIPFKATISLKK